MSTDVERERARIFMPIELALEDEWGKGIAEQRGGDAAAPFVGDALVHLHDQMLGAINYARQVGREDDATAEILQRHDVEKTLRSQIITLRATYKLRESRRLRKAGECGPS